MKRILYFIVLLGFLAGCESIFHNEDSSIGKIENYNDLLTATGGVYGSLADALSEKGFYCANVKGDDITWGDINYDSLFTHWQQTPDNLSFQKAIDNTVVWKTMYSTIVSANNILVQYPSPSKCDREIQKVLGEVYLIRAYCHFRLTRNYGQIPLVSNTNISYKLSQASYNDIYTFIENDLKIAMALLPENNRLARQPSITPHRGTAKALLAEVYLSWAGYPANDATKYQLAASEAGGVIDSAAYFGFALMDDFASLWDNAHMYNSESVFTLYIPNSPTGRNSGFNITEDIEAGGEALYSGRYWEEGNYFLTSEQNIDIQINYFPVENKFYNTYPHQYRKEVTFYTTLYFLSDKKPYFYMDEIYKDNRTGYRKFYYDPTLEDYTWYFGSKKIQFTDHLYLGIPRVYLFRYAQTVLTYAEAKARTGQPDAKAYECVNQIRRRANQLDINTPSKFDLAGLSSEAFADSVVQERAWELCGEPEGRWYDLVRLERVEELSTLRNPEEGGPPFGVYDKSVYFSEIPATDIVLNPNLSE